MDWQAAVREIGDMMSEEGQRQLSMAQIVHAVEIKSEFQASRKRPQAEQTQDAYLQLLRDAIDQKQHQEAFRRSQQPLNSLLLQAQPKQQQ